MFTGIIEESGKILTISQNKIIVEAKIVLTDTKIGDSIAVNGTCLTATEIGEKYFSADISPETMRVTALGDLKIGSYVNLERAVEVGSRLGGHIVSGHIDGLGKCHSIKREGSFYKISIEIPAELTKYIVKKGSITINGISLTVADILDSNVILAVIPHTFENTNLKYLQIGNSVNIETDILAKYVEKFLLTSDNKSGIGMEFLIEHGF